MGSINQGPTACASHAHPGSHGRRGTARLPADTGPVPQASGTGCTAPGGLGFPTSTRLQNTPWEETSADAGAGSSGCQGGAARATLPHHGRAPGGGAGHGPVIPAGPQQRDPTPRNAGVAPPAPRGRPIATAVLVLPLTACTPAPPPPPSRYGTAGSVPRRSPPCGTAGPRCVGIWTP